MLAWLFTDPVLKFLAALANLAAVVAAGVAWWAIRSENKRARENQRQSKLTLSVQLIQILDTRFNDKLRATRSFAAVSLLNRKPDANLEHVLDFFDTVAYLVLRGALDVELVWHTFYYSIHRYFLAADEYITTVRQESPSVWEDLVSLHDQLVLAERRRSSKPEVEVPQKDVDQYLISECSL